MDDGRNNFCSSGCCYKVCTYGIRGPAGLWDRQVRQALQGLQAQRGFPENAASPALPGAWCNRGNRTAGTDRCDRTGRSCWRSRDSGITGAYWTDRGKKEKRVIRESRVSWDL